MMFSATVIYRISSLIVLQALVLTTSANTYLHNGIACQLCPIGTHVRQHCTESAGTLCRACPRGTFTSYDTYRKKCSRCRTVCRRENQVKVANCTKTSDIKCDCKPGYWFAYDEKSFTSKCMEHKTCEPGFGVKKLGTSKSNTECEACPDGFYSSIYSKDYPCKKHTDCADLGLVAKPGSGTKWSDYECVETQVAANVPPIDDLDNEGQKRARPEYVSPPPAQSDLRDYGTLNEKYPSQNTESQVWTVKDIIFIGVAIVLAIALTISITLFVVYRRRICQRKSFGVEKIMTMENNLDTLPRDNQKNEELNDQSQPLVDNSTIVYSDYEMLKKSLHAPLNLSFDDPKRRGLHNMLYNFQLLDDPNAPKTPARFIGRIRRRSNSTRSVDTMESPPASPANNMNNMKIAESMDSVFTFSATDMNIPNNRRHLERLNSTAPTGQELPDLPLNSTVDDLFLYVSRLLGIKRWKDVIRNMPGKKVSLIELDQIEATYKNEGYPEVIYQGFCNWRGKNPYHFNVLDAVTIALQKAEKVTLVERLVLASPPKKA